MLECRIHPDDRRSGGLTNASSRLQPGCYATDAIPSQVPIRRIAGNCAATAIDDGGMSQLTPGHSLIGSISADSADRPATPSAVANGRMNADKKAAAQFKVAGRTDGPQSDTLHTQGFADPQTSKNSTVNEGSVPIQLQGLEFDDEPGAGQGTGTKHDPSSPSDATLRPWSDRLAERRLDSSKNTTTVKTSAESVRPPASTVLAEPPSKSIRSVASTAVAI